MVAILFLLFFELPEPLRRFEAARAAIQNADVRWSVVDSQSWTHPGEAVRYRTFHGGPDTAVFPLDPYDGVPVRTRLKDGTIKETPQAATTWLKNTDGLWEYRVDSALVFQRDIPFAPLMPPDIRLIGMSTGYGVVTQGRIGSVFSAFADGVVFSEDTRDGYAIVTATTTGGSKTRYIIDPETGWNALRIESFDAAGRLRSSVSTRYELRGDVWFPTSCEAVDETTGEIRYSVQIESAEVNSPDLPPRLEPEHIGIQNGMTVVPRDRKRSQLTFLDGRLVPQDDVLHEAIASGRAKVGPKVVEFKRNQGRIDPIEIDDLRKVRVDRSTDEWERYTLRFIDQYQLNETQRQEALTILKRCQAERDEWMRENAPEIERLWSERGERRSRPDFEIRLFKPVQDIFDRKLKPRLFKLPTSDQIEISRDPEQIRHTGTP